jgi:hypothetical protein
MYMCDMCGQDEPQVQGASVQRQDNVHLMIRLWSWDGQTCTLVSCCCHKLLSGRWCVGSEGASRALPKRGPWLIALMPPHFFQGAARTGALCAAAPFSWAYGSHCTGTHEQPSPEHCFLDSSTSSSPSSTNWCLEIMLRRTTLREELQCTCATPASTVLHTMFQGPRRTQGTPAHTLMDGFVRLSSSGSSIR